MNPPRRKQRGITERGFAPITAGGSHPRSKLRGIEPSSLNSQLSALNCLSPAQPGRCSCTAVIPELPELSLRRNRPGTEHRIPPPQNFPAASSIRVLPRDLRQIPPRSFPTSGPALPQPRADRKTFAPPPVGSARGLTRALSRRFYRASDSARCACCCSKLPHTSSHSSRTELSPIP